jgi:hypothetical protein
VTMNARQTERVLRRLVDIIPEQMTEAGYGRGCCILHTRIAVDVLRELDVRARPMAMRVMAGNASWRGLCKQLGRYPQPDEWTAETWCLGIGYGADPRAERPGYDGHVIAVVNDRWGLDLTLDQASRPQKGMRFSPHFWQVSPEFLRGEEHDALSTSEGSVVVYQALPEERGFLTAPDWTLPRKVGSGLNPTQHVLAALTAKAA